MFFKDRQDAGKQLLQFLEGYTDNPNVIILGLARGGVVTAAEVAKGLHAPLDVICPRKVGAPGYAELAIGAVTDTGEGYFNEDIIRSLGVTEEYIRKACEQERKESARRQAVFRDQKPPLDVRNKTIILVDDGIATGATMKAAIASLKAQEAGKIIVAVPVAPVETLGEMRDQADEVYCVHSPVFFEAVGQFYERFEQTTTAEVLEILRKAKS